MIRSHALYPAELTARVLVYIAIEVPLSQVSFFLHISPIKTGLLLTHQPTVARAGKRTVWLPILE